MSKALKQIFQSQPKYVHTSTDTEYSIHIINLPKTFQLSLFVHYTFFHHIRRIQKGHSCCEDQKLTILEKYTCALFFTACSVFLVYLDDNMRAFEKIRGLVILEWYFSCKVV